MAYSHRSSVLGDPREQPQIAATASALRDDGSQIGTGTTVLGPRAIVESQTGARERGLDSGNAATLFDASDGRSVFPMPAATRTFATAADFVAFLQNTLGVESTINDSSGSVGVTGSYAQHGLTYTQVGTTTYRITDPVMAWIGGTSGRINVGSQSVCLDPSSNCTGLPSYLVPQGQFTRPTEAQACQSRRGLYNVCSKLTSFYNRVDLWLLKYARHGSNTAITNYNALPETHLTTNGFISANINSGGGFFRQNLPLPDLQNSGQRSIESAKWGLTVCFLCGAADFFEFQSDAVCGSGSITDPDIVFGASTGNGPANNAVCGF